MGTQMADFVITANKRCFLCLARNFSPASPFKQSVSETFSINSLQLLSSHLRLDMSKVFSEEGNALTHLFAKVKRSTLKVELCDECRDLNEAFSKLCPKLEKIEMEIMSCINSIHQKLVKASKTWDANEELPTNFAESHHNYDAGKILQGKQEIAQVLRSELMRKCSNRIKNAHPQVKIQRLTLEQVNKKRLAMISQRKQTTERESEKFSSNTMVRIQIKVEHSNQVSFKDEDVDDTGDIFDGGSSDSQNEDEEPLLRHPTGFSASKNARMGPAKRKRVVKNNSTRSSSSKTSYSDKSMRDVGPSPKTSKFNRETGRYDCSYCTKSYGLEKSANCHYKTEHLKIRYECTICRQKFVQRCSYFRHHRDVHAHAKLFKCHICDYTSTRKHSLALHVQRVHLRILGKRFQCKFCSKSFYQSGHRNVHMRTNCLMRSNSLEGNESILI